eukprot:308915_1
MTRSSIRQMRNHSYDIWLLVTKLMNTTTDKDINYLSKIFGFEVKNKENSNNICTNECDSTKTKVSLADEIFDENGNIKLNIMRKGYGTDSQRKSTKCSIVIVIIGIVFCTYSVVLLSLVITHFNKSFAYCNNTIE